METLSLVLSLLLYVVAIALLVVLIIIGIRFIKILDKVDELVDNVEDKVNSFDTAISVLSKTANGIANVGDSVVVGITSILSKIFNKKNKEEDDYYE